MRAYSISCSLLDESGVLRRATEFPYLELYVVLVRHGSKRPPSLTPRLFALHPGDRLFAESHAAGNYTVGTVQPEHHVFFFAAGTGEAPHNAMIAELLTRGHQGQIINIVSVRYSRDAAYRACHDELTRRYPNYRYFVLTTRERLNNGTWAASLGRRCHFQDLIVSGELERLSGTTLDPTRTQVFLCGNSEMIGAQHASASSAVTYNPGSMLAVLTARGFRIDQAGEAGSVHFERYW
jgi:ferredoxin--NADP+ reductase